LSDVVEKGLRKMGVTVSKPILAVITLIFGILVILIPQSLSWIVGIYLIIQGALLLTEYYELQSRPAPMIERYFIHETPLFSQSSSMWI
jgi:uncharacterized membrane protein HdeD (DUF308 family)